ncbi:MAG: MltA domain-containing protein [Planctomycetes bacterium]|nr:MltA domain-containing protein [Planctomycetota bacterium]
MKSHLAALLALPLLAAACTTPEYGRPLPPGWPALLKLEPGDERPSFRESWAERHEALLALEHSIAWHQRPSSQQFFPIEGVDHRRSLASLEHFKRLLETSPTPEDFDAAVAVDFDIYKSAGWDGEGGGVLFTGYCTPILEGSLTANDTYRYPLYRLPDDLVKAKDGAILGQRQADGSLAPYPTRAAIEASGHLGNKGLELVYLADPLDAFIAHVNGSAVVRLDDGSERRFGYAGKNGREYRSLGRMLVEDGQLDADEVSLPAIRAWGESHPEELLEYISKDDSFVFFLEIDGPPKGSLNVDVTGGRTLATDKTLFPRGAIVFVDVDVPKKRTAVRTWWDELWGNEFEDYETVVYDRFMFDQDTGGAIRTAGRADIYMGIGDEAEWTAGRMRSPGQMYYLFLKESSFGSRP